MKWWLNENLDYEWMPNASLKMLHVAAVDREPDFMGWYGSICMAHLGYGDQVGYLERNPQLQHLPKCKTCQKMLKTRLAKKLQRETSV